MAAKPVRPSHEAGLYSTSAMDSRAPHRLSGASLPGAVPAQELRVEAASSLLLPNGASHVNVRSPWMKTTGPCLTASPRASPLPPLDPSSDFLNPSGTSPLPPPPHRVRVQGFEGEVYGAIFMWSIRNLFFSNDFSNGEGVHIKFYDFWLRWSSKKYISLTGLIVLHNDESRI
ncbi:uncharacterized protein LOC119336993 [Triticum dicoccoides]|uniref:uncharacterized protein LOC119336993 n=1 Tax=Triticum dicoccoides TaxID=85692 RepID=UPI001891AE4A|nr:uncharacterized protein LOC119336993 [Triticum dicoccoides]XP_037464986.1 uncharacterized protein LOC119336993 [Triticum dicoccoides]XP_037464987.1 uncharacterized protein LOC119336993 [Triticum dicoccoides]XP_037464988.1 uncharacterized protein LOC119336993 [Triticum dicoccoides]